MAAADFGAFLGPLPQLNRLGDLSDLPNNPTGFKVTLVMLGTIAAMFVFGLLEYRWFVKGATSTDMDRKFFCVTLKTPHKDRHDHNMAYFARSRRLYQDDNTSWLRRTFIGLRTRWLIGGCL